MSPNGELVREARSVCHDFNNHLTVVQTFSELLKDGLPPDDPRRHYTHQLLKATDGAVVSLRRLVELLRSLEA